VSTAPLFDELYERYDKWFEKNVFTAENEVKLVKLMVSGAPRPILEVGVGTGYFASKVEAEVGLDPSMKMLSIARMRNVELLIRGVGESLPFGDEVFGTVLIVVTLCFVDDPFRVLKESFRVLRREGLLVSCIVPKDSPWGEFYIKLGSQGHPFYSKARFLTLKEHEKLLELAGFKILYSMGTLSYPPIGEPINEEPSSNVNDKGFVCVKATKRS
jgi:ubiquinone/menaquinone biosynthesis C-methylase UbiE